MIAGRPHKLDSPHPAADLGEVVRIYGIRHWTEQGLRPGQGQAELGRPPAPRSRIPDQLGHGRLRLALLYPGLTNRRQRRKFTRSPIRPLPSDELPADAQ